MSTLKVDTYLTRGGASEIAIDKLKGVTAAGSMLVVGEGGTVTTNLQQGLCKSWINFNGTGTIAITDSFNVTSIADEATGYTTVTIANDMANTTYSVVGSCGPQVGTSLNVGVTFQHESSPQTATRVAPVTRRRNDNTDVDCTLVYCQIMGDLA